MINSKLRVSPPWMTWLSLIPTLSNRSPGRIPDAAPNVDAGATIPTPAFVIGAKSLLRLKAAAKLVRYYQTVYDTILLYIRYVEST